MYAQKIYSKLRWIILLALLLSACTATAQPAPLPEADLPSPAVSAQQIETELPAPTPASVAQVEDALVPIHVEYLAVEVGVGSPIPVEVVVDGTWPGLCTQIAEIRQTVSGSHFDIALLATPPDLACGEDLVGLFFHMRIPLNMVKLPVGSYSVTVNGETVAFEWDYQPNTYRPPEPLEAQGNPFAFEGVTFTLDPQIAASASGEVVPSKALTPDGPYWDVNPQYRRIQLNGYALANTFHKPVISIYPVDEYRAFDPRSGEMIDKLYDFLHEQSPAPEGQIPLLPLMNAGQVFHSNVEYFGFRSGTGVRFLTILAQYTAPVNNYDLFYTYQGLTSNGQYIVSMILPINHPMLLQDASGYNAEMMEEMLADPNYYQNWAASLEAEDPNSFTPSLEKLDALVRSLEINLE